MEDLAPLALDLNCQTQYRRCLKEGIQCRPRMEELHLKRTDPVEHLPVPTIAISQGTKMIFCNSLGCTAGGARKPGSLTIQVKLDRQTSCSSWEECGWPRNVQG